MLMLLVSWVGSSYLVRKKELPRYLLMTLVGMTFAGCIATIAGWYVTEIGRQPWLVQGVLSTKDALGTVTGGMVLSTLIMYLSVYVFLSIAYVFTLFHLARSAGGAGAKDLENPSKASGERLSAIPTAAK